MPRKKRPDIQPNLFDGQLTPEEIKTKRTAAIAFELFSAEIPKWHKFQDTPDGFGGAAQGGNCFFWWRSRYGDWLQDKIPDFERRSKFDKVFKEIWLDYEPEMTRNKHSLGLPDKAY